METEHVANKNCVISAVGKNSLHREWIKGSPDFDLHLIVYDDSYHRFREDAISVTCKKGCKLKLIYSHLQENPGYLEKYEYYFFPDDDICTDAANITELFRIMKEQDLQIAQPALSDSYYTFEHTLRDRFCMLRYTNFVEMMLPCFSREALKKVLFTFNENKSGWGLEYHWPRLISFTCREMAVIDSLHMVHTRPVQSGSRDNWRELNAYLKKYQLSRDIKETGFVQLPPESRSESGGLLTDRYTYKIVTQLMDFIVDKLLHAACMKQGYATGIPEFTGISRLLAGYYCVSGKRKYLDQALSVAETARYNAMRVMTGTNPESGIIDLTKCFKFLARHGFIESDSYEDLKTTGTRFTDSFSSLAADLQIDRLLRLAQYYTDTPETLFPRNEKPDLKEPERLQHIIQAIYRWSCSLSYTKQEESNKYITNCLFVMCQVRKKIVFPEINLIIEKITGFLNEPSDNDKLPYLLKIYLMILASEATGDMQLRNETIHNAVYSYTPSKEIGFQGTLNLYLLYRIYQHTGEAFFRQHALEALNTLIRDRKKETLPSEINSLIQPGLILLT